MEGKLQELTEKLYQEGIEKANQDAEQIIQKAKKEASEIIKNAQKEANNIIAQAEKRSEEIRKNVQSEVKLAANQAISAIKQQIVNLITAKIVEPPIQEAFNDVEFIKKIIEIAIKNWNPKEHERVDLTLLLPKKHEEELGKYFLSNGIKLIRSGLEVHFDENLTGGFQIGPKDGTYKISFTDEDFENFFKEYLRPRTIQILYGGE